jgi:membrane protein implicated in regulation of membrane protease activity
MNETKFHHVMMYITFFSLGTVFSGLAISLNLFREMVFVMFAGMVWLFISLVYNFIRGIDYMQEHHPDYKGEDLFDEGETESKL